jgi:electron transfer flavoprotein alpha subunit
VEKMLKEKERILVIIEKERERIAPVSLEALRAGRELSHKGEQVLSACLIGHGIHDLADELSYFTDEVIVLDNPLLANFDADIWTSALAQVCGAAKPVTIMMGHTYDTMDLAPRLAFRTGCDLVTDCVTIVRSDDGSLHCEKPIYGANAVVTIAIETVPQMVTTRPKHWHVQEKGENKGQIVAFDCKPELFKAQTELIELVPGESVNLDKADAIVAAGRGVKSAEGVAELGGLMKALESFFDHVELGASRPLVDEGILPRSRQVGQTGEKVSPQLYVAIGISGAAQHLSGIVTCKKVIAINKDPDASIFNGADYGIVASYEDVLPGLIKKLEEL